MMVMACVVMACVMMATAIVRAVLRVCRASARGEHAHHDHEARQELRQNLSPHAHYRIHPQPPYGLLLDTHMMSRRGACDLYVFVYFSLYQIA